LYYNPFTFIPSGGGVNISSGGGVSSYALTYAAGSGGSLTGATAQTISRGNSGTAVTAVASTGYHFVNWSDNSTANPRTDANVTGNITVSANFARNPAPTITSISLNSGPVAGGTSLTITGANFSNLGGSPDVSFGGNLVLATYVSTSSLTVVTPAGVAGTVDVTVSNPDGQSATKVNGFTYISAPAAIAVTSGNSQITTINSMFVSPLAVVVTDALGNPVSGVSVTFTAPNSGASGIFADSRTTTTMAITNASGVATSPALTANGIAGSYQIIATSGALVTHFNLTNQDAI
jgi:hypothetical protein